MLTRPGPAPASTPRYGSDPDQVLDVYPAAPDGPGLPTVVLVHGGYWRPAYDRLHTRSAAAALGAVGFPTALIEYRRSPGDPDASVTDVWAAIRAVAAGSVGLPGGPVILVGHSAGGHLALVAASEDGLPVAGCLALAPIADLHLAEELALEEDAVPAFLGVPARDRPDLDPARLPLARPTLVLHGEQDSVVPVAVSESFVERSGARYLPVPGTGHFELIDPTSQAWSGVIAQLRAIATATGIE